MAIFVVTINNAQLLDFGVITSIYSLQFGYVALIVTMRLTLSDEVIGTERELEEKAALLTAQTELYRRLLKKIWDDYDYAVFSHAPDGIFPFMSPGSKALFGKEPQDLIGTNRLGFPGGGGEAKILSCF